MKRRQQIMALATLALASVQAHAACTFGSSGEPSLQSALDSLLGTGTLDAASACVDDGDDAAWSTIGRTGEIDIVLELSSNASTNSFGVYDLNDPGTRLTIFDGNDAAGDQAVLRLRQMGDEWRVSVQEAGARGWTHRFISTNAFGFYLATRANGTFFSETSRNSDGVDHLYSYQGTGAPFMSGPLRGEVFAVQDYLLAWEDLAGGGDRDYQDFVALVQDITPVPLPTPVIMLMSGLIGLAGVSRRGA